MPDAAGGVCAPIALTNGNFALPRFAPDVPASIDICGAGSADAYLARALLDAGILSEEQDWRGELLPSLQAGLSRWVNEVCGCGGLRAVDAEVCVTSDIDNWNMDFNDWIAYYEGLPLPVCGVAIEAQTFEYVYVERAVRAWEAKKKGLGWALLLVAETALMRTIRIASPSWALGYLDSMEWDDLDESTAEEDDGFPTWKKLRASVPKEMFKPRKFAEIEALIQRSIRMRRFSAEERGLLLEAQALLNLLPLTATDDFGDEHHCFEETEQVIPLGLRWNAEDRVPQICDFFHDNLAHMGGQSHFVYFCGFQFGSPTHTVENAFRNMALCLQIVGRACRLLEALDGNALPLKSHNTPLAEVFAADPRMRQERNLFLHPCHMVSL